MKRQIQPCIYILTNIHNNVIYTGVTADLFERVAAHKEKSVNGFTRRYNVMKLVYYEEFATMQDAISREKQIKGGSRQKKVELINSMNPDWKDLYEDFLP